MLSPVARETKRGPDEPAPSDGSADTDVEHAHDEDTSRGRRIRCPACGWQPGRHHQWMCTCLCSWNTFETAGLCPECGKQWTETQCPRCHVWSKHERWYEPPQERD